MIVLARNTLVGDIYRLTRPVHPGTYYQRLSTPAARRLARLLRERAPASLTTEQLRTLAAADAACASVAVLMRHLMRYCTIKRKRCERSSYVGVPLDYAFRRVAKKPPYPHC